MLSSPTRTAISVPSWRDEAPSTTPRGLARETSAILIGVAAGVVGAWGAVHYARAGLALSHYDARAHLVVARRIFDSLSPGWQQIGAIWLPLPHLLNMLPVQVDAWYRNGASGTAISVMSTSLVVWALSSLLIRITGSILAALTGAALIVLNPNLLYLQSTPMTEPLLFGTMLLAAALIARWIDGDPAAPATSPGLALTAACMTRYEAWPTGCAMVVLAAVVMVRRGFGLKPSIRACARLSAYPVIAALVFVVNSRWTVGQWFVSSGFFVAENKARGNALLAWDQLREGAYQLSSTTLMWAASIASVLIIGAFLRSRTRASLLLLLALAAAVVLPWLAYWDGHPTRIRYSLPLVLAAATIIAAGIALLPRWIRAFAAPAVIAATVIQAPPLDRNAPLIAESQRDARNKIGREAVTKYLVDHYDGTPIMMSMGSLAHYMHDLSQHGFRIHDFLHEGNGELWVYATLLGPRGMVRWVVVEEQAEGGDVLFERTKRDPHFFDGYTLVAEGGGVALYEFR